MAEPLAGPQATERDGLAERVEALEVRAAYQDETIEALSGTIAEQWAIIDRLKRELEQLGDRLEDAASGAGPVDRPPPHY
jgi:SlyX protein